ncbi:RHS repeat domain-containing protein [Nitrosomonas sp.]|uniref:RHS repeat domain-containing protein n=1 Tax=Nitrosomonas sp. TaxID=42353 RepID=UPI0025DAAEAD|nr:RHS repeat-associated core domain-containing protein [Nitrosomonas sp.]
MKAYSFDAADNPSSDGATTFTWNVAGKLSTTVNNGKTHAYKYNALEQRVSKNGPLSSKFTFFYDEAGQLIGEYRDNSSTATPTDDWLVRQETIWPEDIPVAVIKKSTATGPIQIYFIHADHLNTPRVIVNQSNTPVSRWENTHAFGANLPDEDPDCNSQLFEYHPRYPGQYFDKETNLHYNYFRYYEPETGRYISPDPIGLAGGINTFGYALQNPLSFVDPTGKAVPVLIAACAANPACAAAVGTGIGALTSALFDFGSQLLNNDGNLQCVDKGSLALSAGIGAIPLGAVVAIGSKVLGQFVPKIGLPVVKSAQSKLGSLADRFGRSSDNILEQGLKGRRFRDVNNSGNINVFSPRPDGKNGFLRITLDPKGERVISAGLNKARDVNRGIDRGRFNPLE